MADEQVQEPQETAEEKVNVPEGVLVPETTIQRGEFIKIENASKDFVKKYGFSNYREFLAGVGSDSILSAKVINDLLAEKFDGEVSKNIGISPDSPQENNITGKLDHTEDVAKKLKTDAQTDLKPTSVA